MKVIVEQYNPEWKAIFQLEKQNLKGSISESDIVIEHIGSTSVQDLGAKPIIDIMIGLKNFKTADNLVDSIVNVGYEYISEYNEIIPFRRFFIKSKNRVKEFHVHMVGYETEFWNRHLAFRNHLRENKKDRESYFNLKYELAKKEWQNGDEYARAKSEFISRIEKKIARNI